MNNLYITSFLSMTGLAVFFAVVLAFADKKLKVKEDPKVEEITHLLPGVNCGACGALSCRDFAEHVVKERVDPAKCRVMHEDARKKIYEIMGTKETETFPMLPLVRCAAEWDQKKTAAEYKGVKTCGAANELFGGGMECGYGCIGFSDCVRVCQFDAIHMENGLPKVETTKCTGCGKCQEACPRGIIEMLEKANEKLFYVACSSHDDMMRTRKICPVGCISCGICVKLSKDGFFQITENLSKERVALQGDPTALEAIQAKCPTKVIKVI